MAGHSPRLGPEPGHHRSATLSSGPGDSEDMCLSPPNDCRPCYGSPGGQTTWPTPARPRAAGCCRGEEEPSSGARSPAVKTANARRPQTGRCYYLDPRGKTGRSLEVERRRRRDGERDASAGGAGGGRGRPPASTSLPARARPCSAGPPRCWLVRAARHNRRPSPSLGIGFCVPCFVITRGSSVPGDAGREGPVVCCYRWGARIQSSSAGRPADRGRRPAASPKLGAATCSSFGRGVRGSRRSSPWATGARPRCVGAQPTREGYVDAAPFHLLIWPRLHRARARPRPGRRGDRLSSRCGGAGPADGWHPHRRVPVPTIPDRNGRPQAEEVYHGDRRLRARPTAPTG